MDLLTTEVNVMRVRFLFICCTLHAVYSAEIILLPYPWPSHVLQLEIIGGELARRGHNVTMVTPTTERFVANQNIRWIAYRTSKVSPTAIFDLARETLQNDGRFGIAWLFKYLDILRLTVVEAIEDAEVAAVARRADLVLTDVTYTSAPAFADHFGLEMASISPIGFMSALMGDVFGIPDVPAYMPTCFTASYSEVIGYTNEMTFLERSVNFAFFLVTKFTRHHVILPYLSSIEKYMKKSLFDAWSANRLVLIPMDFAVEDAVPLPPMVKVIRPFTLRPHSPLPNLFKNIVSSTDMNTLLVTFGAMDILKPSNMEVLLQSFLELNMNVIWKFNQSKMFDFVQISKKQFLHSQMVAESVNCDAGNVTPTPTWPCGSEVWRTSHEHRKTSEYLKIGSNVYIFDWVPQNDLLGHSRVTTFLSHCGRNGMYEAIYHNVSLICMPLFGDQWSNAAVIQSKKLGISINKAHMDISTLRYALNDINKNPIYRESITEASFRLRKEDRATVIDAVVLLEKIIDDQDIAYLRPKMSDLSFYQSLMFDVYIFLIVAVIALSWTTVKLLSFLTLKYRLSLKLLSVDTQKKE